MILKCVIIDDEPLAVDVIQNYIERIKGLEITAIFNSALDSLEFLQQNQVDLLFLDINMPVLDGYSFLESLSNKPQVIITTAYAEYAVKGYELEVLDYLLKPIPFPRFLQAVNKAVLPSKTFVQNTVLDKEHIFVKVNSKKMKKIFIDDILLVESLKDYIKIITTSGNYIVHQSLTGITNHLPSHSFLRIHRSYTVAVSKIDVIEGNSIEINGTRYTIGRSYINEAKKRILKSGLSNS
ncbi:MAG TPA: response regulator transcription factor [Salegentibacter sp.]|uniref:LytR/AlgR family response regulator transcription factor n=1 Tax=Salegentibacter sp. TaxID=1903072 RepID=UPI002F951810